jgi:hypothetical protein
VTTENQAIQTTVPARRRAVHLVLAILLLPALGIVTVLRYERLTQPTLEVVDGALIVKTRAREVYPISEITALSLETRLPEIVRKEEGLARGGRLSGRFTLRGLGAGRVVVNTAAPPYVLVRTATGFLFLNFAEPDRTRALYLSLMRQWHPPPAPPPERSAAPAS